MMTETVKKELMLINGEWVEGVNAAFIPIENPANRGSVVAEVPQASAEDVNKAVEAAHEAFLSWREVLSSERAKLLWEIANTIEDRAEELARTISTETGNAIRTDRKSVG